MFLWFDALKIKLNLTESNYNHFIDTNTESASVQLNFQQWNCKSSNDEVNSFKIKRDHLQKYVQDCL